MLEQLYLSFALKAHLQSDPVRFVHQFKRKEDQEIVGLLCASLAFGQVKSISNSIERILIVIGKNPSNFLAKTTLPKLLLLLKGFKHRIYKGEDVARLLKNASNLQKKFQTLEKAFKHFQNKSNHDFREGLALFADSLRGKTHSASLRHLVSDPRAGSACKRLLLYLKWMVRQPDGVDLGIWDFPSSELLIPVDTHILRMGTNLGFTKRKTATWQTSVEITHCLKGFDKTDPTKFDFVLCHTGISKKCLSKKDLQVCKPCILKPICIHWKNKT